MLSEEGSDGIHYSSLEESDNEEEEGCDFFSSEQALVSLPPDASRAVSLYGKREKAFPSIS